MTIADWLARAAAGEGGARPALYRGTDLVADYAGFARAAAGFAGWLHGQGVAPGDRVAIHAANCPEYLVALWGIWWAGAVAVPVNAKLHGREVAWIIGNSGAVLAIVGSDAAGALAEATAVPQIALDSPAWAHAVQTAPRPMVARAADDLAWLFYTSGTTGRPKGVMITHRMMTVMALSYCTDVDVVTPDDTAIYAAPLSHGAGLYCVMHVLRGARHVCPASGGFDVAELLALARAHGRAHLFAAPTMVKRMTADARAAGDRGTGLRTVVYGGGPMYQADIIDAVDWFGPVFAQIYGQGECPMGITALSKAEVADRSHPRWAARLGSVGRAQAGVQVRIAGAHGADLPCGQMGEIVVRGDLVMPGYWQNPAASADALRDGWLWTGDMGAMDADGYVTLQDRSKDLIISGGSNIYPREVEEVLTDHPAVFEAAVVGAPDPEWGEVVVAFVVAAPGAALDPAALDAHCLTRIARFKRPKRYVAVPALPKNNYGKVLKTDLRARLRDGA